MVCRAAMAVMFRMGKCLHEGILWVSRIQAKRNWAKLAFLVGSKRE